MSSNSTQEYGHTSYWDDRYALSDEGFDWLFSFQDVKHFLDAIYANRGSDCKSNERFLLTGAGNAPFSNDLYQDGYKNIVNIDTSVVVIDQMQKLHPHMEWVVMDALEMSFPSKSFDNIIDKSLIDTILCYSNSVPCTRQLMREAFRVLKPGGFLISFSLHSWKEIERFFYEDDLGWTVMPYHIPNARWNESENVNRCVVHSMVLCVKHGGEFGASDSVALSPFNIPNTFSDEEVAIKMRRAKEIIESRLFAKLDTKRLRIYLQRALEAYELITFESSCSDEVEDSDQYDESEKKHQIVEKKASSLTSACTNLSGRSEDFHRNN